MTYTGSITRIINLSSLEDWGTPIKTEELLLILSPSNFRGYYYHINS